MAVMSTAAGSVLKALWPVIVVAAGGLIAWGNLKSDVAHIKEQQDVMVPDHDRMVRMDERQAQLQRDVTEMKADIKELVKASK